MALKVKHLKHMEVLKKKQQKRWVMTFVGGGFKYVSFLCSTLLGEMIQFRWVETTN